MSANDFITTPPAVIVWDPILHKCRSAFVALGDVPAAVFAAATKNTTGVLKEYYGPSYKEKLLIGVDLDSLVPAGGKDGGWEGGCCDVTGGNDVNSKNSGYIERTTKNTTKISTQRTGSADDELDDIEQLLTESIPAVKTVASDVRAQGAINVIMPEGVTYTQAAHIYPEDKYNELKSKIYLITGIPPYRQHIFYLESGRPQTIYKLYTDGIIPIDIRSLKSQGTLIHGIPIDKSIYEARDTAKVESLDVFQTLGSSLPIDNRIFVVDLGAITNPRRTQLIDLLKDTYQFELLYYGFILKYWPQLTLDCFRDYIADEQDLQHKYPDLAPSANILRSLYKHESSIVDQNYRNMPKLLTLADSDSFGLAITQMVAQVNGNRTMLNIRNIFEYFRATNAIPEIHAWIEHENKRYILVKKHVQTEDVQFPSGNIMRTGITFAIALGGESRYMFLNIWPSGRYHIKTVWNEEDELGFDEILVIMKKHVDGIIADINKLGYYAFISMGRLTPLTSTVLTYQSLNVCMFWKRVMTETTYKMVKALWEPYFRAGITKVRNVQQFDKYEFTLCKGIYQFDNTAIERIISASNNLTVNNYYAHLSNQQIRQKWDQNYDGRILRMSHRTTDIRFELVDIREQEFQTAQTYLLGFIYHAMNESNVKKSLESRRDYTDIKKLRKLREQDPELYNLKKHGSTKVYSIVCQNQRQPVIYTEDELRSMSAKDKAKLTEYWNFTLQKPAWYGCPTSAYPHLSFMVGVHPKHYCLPCCNKKLREDDESRKTRVNAICAKNHQWTEESDGGISRHIMNYGKDIDVGRLSKLPQTTLGSLLRDTTGIVSDVRDDSSDNSDNSDNTEGGCLGGGCSEGGLDNLDITSAVTGGASRKTTLADYYLYGVPQHFPGIKNVGIVYAIAAGLSINVTNMLGELISALAKINIDTLLRGTLTEYFPSTRELIASMRELFLEHRVIPSVRLPYWPELFIELVQIVYNTSVVTFIDSTGTGVGINLHVTESVKNAVISGSSCMALMKRDNNYYPMFIINPDTYFRRMEITMRVYQSSHPFNRLIQSMIKSSMQQASHGIFGLQAVKDFCKSSGMTLVCKYVNQHNLCYGVLLSVGTEGGANSESTGGMEGGTEGGTKVYVPVEYSTNLPDNITVEPYPSDNLDLRLEATISVFSQISKFIAVYNIPPIVITSLIYYNEVMIGAKCRIGTIYINGAGNSNIPIEKVNYDFRDVNKTISNREKPLADPRTENLGAAIYRNCKYQLLVIEFVNYLDKERNDDVRQKIYALIADTNFKKDLAKFRSTLKTLAHGNDYALLQSQVSDFYLRGATKNALKETIENSIYEFDRTTLAYLQSLPHEKARDELLKIVSTFATEGEPTTNEFPNVYLPCEESHAGYCSGKKLVLSGLREFVDVLADDIKDELRVAFLLNNIWMDAVIDMFKFTKVPTEIISIYKLD